MDRPERNELLYNLQKDVDIEVWQFMAAGFKMMPMPVRLLIQRNANAILETVKALGTTEDNVFYVALRNDGSKISSLVTSIQDKMLNSCTDYDVYFYQEPLGHVKRNAGVRKWLLVTIPKPPDRIVASLEYSLSETCINFVKKANIVVAHG